MNNIKNVKSSEIRCLYPVKKTGLVLLWICNLILMYILFKHFGSGGIFGEFILFMLAASTAFLLLATKAIWNYIRPRFRTIPVLTQYYDNGELLKSIDKDDYKSVYESRSFSKLFKNKYSVYNGNKWIIISSHYFYKDIIAGVIVTRPNRLWVIYYTGETCRVKIEKNNKEDIEKLLEKIHRLTDINCYYMPHKSSRIIEKAGIEIQRITGIYMSEIDYQTANISNGIKHKIRKYLSK